MTKHMVIPAHELRIGDVITDHVGQTKTAIVVQPLNNGLVRVEWQGNGYVDGIWYVDTKALAIDRVL